jgi:hypothetical protein
VTFDLRFTIFGTVLGATTLDSTIATHHTPQHILMDVDLSFGTSELPIRSNAERSVIVNNSHSLSDAA